MADNVVSVKVTGDASALARELDRAQKEVEGLGATAQQAGIHWNESAKRWQDAAGKFVKGGGDAKKAVDDVNESLDETTSRSLGTRKELIALLERFGGVGQGAGKLVEEFGKVKSSMSLLGTAAGPVGIAITATVAQFAILATGAYEAASAIVSLAETTIPKANALKAAFTGLEAIAKFKGIEPGAATSAVQSLDAVKLGLISAGDAALVMKNILGSGNFTIQQASVLFNRLADQAVNNKTASLSFAEALKSGSEGLRTQSSELLNNLGIATNLSTMLERQGLKLDDLTSKTKGSAAATALYNALLEETVAAQGDAGRYADTFAGSLAKLEAASESIQAKIGDLFIRNEALGRAFKLVGEGAELASKNFDKYADGLSLIVGPIAFLTGGVLSLFIGSLAVIGEISGLVASGLGLIAEGIGLVTYNLELQTKGEHLRQFGSDLRDLSGNVALAAGTLPGDMARIRGALKNDGGQKVDLFSVLGFVAGVSPSQLVSEAKSFFNQLVTAHHDALVKQLEAEKEFHEKVAAEQKAILDARKQASAGLIDLERQTRDTLRQIAAQADPSTGGELDRRLAVIHEEDIARVAAYTEKIRQLKAELARTDPFATGGLDEKLARFREESAQLASEQEEQARSDAARKIAEDLKKQGEAAAAAAEQIGRLREQILADDNPEAGKFAKIFEDADKRTQDFKKSVEGLADAVKGPLTDAFLRASDQIKDQALGRLRTEIAGLIGDLGRLGEQVAGISPSGPPSQGALHDLIDQAMGGSQSATAALLDYFRQHPDASQYSQGLTFDENDFIQRVITATQLGLSNAEPLALTGQSAQEALLDVFGPGGPFGTQMDAVTTALGAMQVALDGASADTAALKGSIDYLLNNPIIAKVLVQERGGGISLSSAVPVGGAGRG